MKKILCLLVLAALSGQPALANEHDKTASHYEAFIHLTAINKLVKKIC